jgi:hypothetical protein
MNMDSNLAEALLNKGVLKQDTEIDAVHTVSDMAGLPTVTKEDTFTVVQAKKGDQRVWVLATRNSDGRRVQLPDTAITRIDGMDPDRCAKAFNLRADGSKARTGKKRGRKPKHRPAA